MRRKGCSFSSKNSSNLLNRFLAVCCLCLMSCLSSVHIKDVANSLTMEGNALVAAKQYAAAKVKFQRALDFDEAMIPALSGLGKISVTEKSWQSALSWFEKVLKFDPNNFEAHYYLAYSYRERGRERYYLEKIMSLLVASSFDKALDQFKWILSRDSLYQDVLYQYALLYEVEREYPMAISMALRQIELKPGLRVGPVGLFKIYRGFIATYEGKTPPAQVAQPTSDFDRFFSAEWERKKGKIEEAESELLALMEKPGLVPTQLISQALARVKAKRGQDENIEPLIAGEIDSVKTMGEADVVLEDIKYILRDEELHQYQALDTPDEAVRFLHSFWGKRNPNPTATTNARIAEHYHRLVYAEENFEMYGVKTFAKSANDTWLLHFPESYYLNEEFNDKGVIYLHHGLPDEKVMTASVFEEKNESWLYHATDEFPEMLFDFHVMEGSRVSDWRLVPMFTNPALWQDRTALAERYSRLAFSTGMESRSDAKQRFLTQAIDEGTKTVSSALAKDSYKWSTSVRYLESPVSLTCFRGSNGKTHVDISYVIAPQDLAKEFADTLSPLRVDAEFSMHNSAWKRIADDQKSSYYRRQRGSAKSVIEIFHTLVPPDSYSVAWQAKPVGANLVINNKFQALVLDFSGTSLNMSDVELAYDIGVAKQGNEFNKGSLYVVPNPLRRYASSRPLYLYFEVYNLGILQAGKSSYTIEYQLKCLNPQTSFVQRLLGLGKKSSIAFRATREGTVDWSPEHIALDVRDLEPGGYELQVKVTDDVRKATVSRLSKLEIFED